MSSYSKAFSSTLGKKLIMSLTGLFLSLFLVVHLLGNLQLFKHDDGMAFNDYSYFMTHFPPIKIVSYLLYLSIVLHAVYALIITLRNKSARKTGYAVSPGSANASWSSRNMGILGTVLLIFIVTHMANFWAQYHWGGLPTVKYEQSLINPSEVKVTHMPYSGQEISHQDYIDQTNQTRVLISKDLYAVVVVLFGDIAYVALYVIAMIAMGFHLYHGFQSGFQTLGFDHNRYKPFINFIGVWVFSIIIPAMFALMPIYIYLTH